MLCEQFNQLGDAVHASRWKNLIFEKSGKSHLGCIVWPSRESAKSHADFCDRELALRAARGVPDDIMVDGGRVAWEDYSHSVAVPWRE